jgi:hypothetical protein
VATNGILTFQDNPGYTPNWGLLGDTDIHYTFGASWRLFLDGVELFDTGPLFGVIQGAHPRTFTPAALETARLDLNTQAWDLTAAPSLVQAMPVLPGPYVTVQCTH